MILFDTEPDIAAFAERNLKTQEKLAVSGYTWVGENRQHKEGGGAGYFIKNTIKNFCKSNTTTEILWIKLKLKKARKPIYRCFIWKTRGQTLYKRIRRRI